MISKIVVPLDGSEISEKIGEWIASLARPLGAEVVVLTISKSGESVSSDPYYGDGQQQTGSSEAGSGIENKPAANQKPSGALEYVRDQSEKLGLNGVSTTYKVLSDDPADEIVRYAREVNADLIAMATHRGSVLARGILGSVTDRVLHSAGLPVLAMHPEGLNIPGGDGGQPETIIVPLDGSKRSAEVVDLAISIAGLLKAEIVFFKAAPNPFSGLVSATTPVADSFERGETEDYLVKFKEAAEAKGIRARTSAVTGPPAVRLLEEAEQLPKPLIIMSTRGHSGIRRWAFGSVTDKVIRSSGLPVIVVPPGSKKD